MRRDDNDAGAILKVSCKSLTLRQLFYLTPGLWLNYAPKTLNSVRCMYSYHK